MADAEIVIAIKSDGTGARVIKRDLDDIARGGDKAAAAGGRLERQIRSTGAAAQVLSRAMGALFAVVGAREIIRMADSVTQLQGRLQNATRSVSEAEQAFQGLRGIVQRTGTDMETAVSVFQRLSFVRDEIGATVDEMLKFTDIVSKLGVISGAGTTAMRAGLTQLGQALSANIVRAEEWNSIMENIPAVGVQIAEQFKVTTGELRQLIIAGDVLSEDVFAAMINSAADVEEQFAKMPITIGRAFAALRSDMELFVGQSAEASNASLAFIGIIDTIRIAINGLSYTLERAILGVGTFSAILRAPFDATFTIKDAVREYDEQVKKLNASFQTPQNTVFDRAFGASASSSQSAPRQIKKDYEALAKTISGDQDKSVKKAQNELTSAIKSTRTEQEKLLDEIKQLENSRGLAKTTGQAEELEVAISRSYDELEKIRIEAERNGPLAKAFESLAKQVDEGFREAFRNAFTESDGGWKKLLEGWKASFKAFLADLAYTALARPIILSMVGGVGGALGVSSGASASILGDIGGSGGGFGGLGNLSSLGSSFLNGGLYSSTLGNIGAKIGGLFGGGGIGPSTSSFIGAQAFGNLGYGAIGGGIASLLGLGGGIGGTIGGTLGSLAGGGIGASLGTILGFAGGPVGSLAGSFIGTALGGLFGGKSTPSNAADIAFSVQNGQLATGRVASDEASGERLKQIKTTGSNITDAINGLLQAVGGTLESAPNFRIGATRREPGVSVIQGMRGQGQSGAFIFNSFQKAIDFTLTSVLSKADLGGVSDAFEAKFKEIFSKGGSFEERVSEVLEVKSIFDLVNGFESLGESIKPLGALLDDLDAQFEDLRSKAIDLGLPVDKLTQSYEKQKQQLIQGVLSPLQDFLDSQALSSQSSLSAVERLSLARSVFDENLSAIRGGDYSGLDSLTGQASNLLSIGRDVFASGSGFNALESFVRQSVSGVAGDLGAPGGLNDSVAREMTLATAEQTSILQQINVEMQELREENRRLRKSMERIGNAVVQMTA